MARSHGLILMLLFVGACAKGDETISLVGDPAALGAPVLLEPADGDTGIWTPFVIRWDTVPNASFYSVQMWTDSAGITVPFDSYTYVTTTYRTILGYQPDEHGLEVFWRVRAENGPPLTETGPWSTTFHYTTAQ